MTVLRSVCLALVLLPLISVVGLCAETPEAALDKLMSADTMETVLPYLPNSDVNFFSKSSVAPFFELLLNGHITGHQIKSRKTGPGQWQITDNNDQSKRDVKLKNSLTSGADAVLILEIDGVPPAHEEQENKIVFVGMHLQDSKWQLSLLGTGALSNLDDLKKYWHHIAVNEAGAVGGLRTLNAVLINYFTFYEKFPESLANLGGQPDNASQEHAGFIDEDLASGTKYGYRFHYTRTGSGSYTITARPLEFGKTGTHSFFTEQTGVLWYTTEDREPTAKDPVL